LRKFSDFLKFRRWLINKVEKGAFDKIIVLSTLTGIILGRHIYRRKQNYIFDIRDYSYEKIIPFYLIEKKLIYNSAFTAISSKGFQSFLPKYDYVIAHNFNRNEIKTNYRFKKEKGPINFVWNGVVRYFEYQKQYLDALKNDERFRIIYHGDGVDLEKYKSYCSENGFNNVIFTGSYKNEEKEALLTKAHILNNCYGYIENSGNKIKYAVSNRFYDGIIFHLPQLVEPEGFKTEWVKESGVGISSLPKDALGDNLYEYYWSINEENFNQSCNDVLEIVIREDDYFIHKIDEFIDSTKDK
jgi:hypothetical protein